MKSVRMLFPTIQFYKAMVNYSRVLPSTSFIVDGATGNFNIRKLHQDTSSLPVTFKSNPETDILLEKLQATSSSDEITSLIQENASTLTAKHCATALRHISLHLRTDCIVKSDLTMVCNVLTRKARFLTVNEVINVISDLNKLQISPRTIAMQTMLHHLRSQINFLSFKQIFFLEGIFKRMEATSLVTSLRTALPIVVKNHLDMQLNRDDLHELTQLFRYAAYHKYEHRQLKRISETIMGSKLEWTAVDASTILWGLTSLNRNDAQQYADLMKKAIFELSRNIKTISSQEFIKLLQYLHKRNFLNRLLFKLATQKAILEKWDLENVHFLSKLASENRYIDLNLLNIYSKLVEDAINDRSLAISIFEVIDVLASINFTPYNLNLLWEWTKVQLDKEQLHPKKVVELISNLITLGLPCSVVYDPIFLKYDLASFLIDKQESDIQTIKKGFILLQLMNDGHRVPAELKRTWLEKLAVSQMSQSESIGFPLKRAVHTGFLNDFHICDSFITISGIYIDHLLVKKSDSISFEVSDQLANGQVFVMLNQLPIHVKRIAIVLRTLKDYAVDSLRLSGDPALVSRALQHEGFHVIEICYEEWKELLEKEHVSFLIRAVNECYSDK